MELINNFCIRGDLIQVFKIVHGLDKMSFDDFFKLSDYSGIRGHSFKLGKQYSTPRLMLESFSSLGDGS